MKCTMAENISSNVEPNLTVDIFEWVNLQINDESVYPFSCKNGHKNVLIHQEEKFELLFESAVHAISDGYFKEAVSSIASSIERLYEYCINVISLKNKILPTDIETSWKTISSQSERQLGAFIFLYLLEFKKCPPLLNNNQITFRNKVIHKGYFPTFQEVLDFGEATLRVMFEILISLRQNCKESIHEHQMLKAKDMFESTKIFSITPTVLSSPTIIHMAENDDDFSKGVTLKEYLKGFKK